jgi:predicted neutral ceramidase superfamily lipid hydrolase
VDKLGLELVKALSLVYTYLLILLLNFMYMIRVNEVFFKVIDHLGNYLKGVNSIELILSV